MARHLAFGGAPRTLARPMVGRGTTCVASLVFVTALGAAFWAGAVWIGQALITWSGGYF